jgi:hypothetical protein
MTASREDLLDPVVPVYNKAHVLEGSGRRHS